MPVPVQFLRRVVGYVAVSPCTFCREEGNTKNAIARFRCVREDSQVEMHCRRWILASQIGCGICFRRLALNPRDRDSRFLIDPCRLILGFGQHSRRKLHIVVNGNRDRRGNHWQVPKEPTVFEVKRNLRELRPPHAQDTVEIVAGIFLVIHHRCDLRADCFFAQKYFRNPHLPAPERSTHVGCLFGSNLLKAGGAWHPTLKQHPVWTLLFDRFTLLGCSASPRSCAMVWSTTLG